MKKILSIILSLVLIIGTAPLVFADTVPTESIPILTDTQISERDAFLVIYNEQKVKLDALRTEEKALVTANNALSEQIRTILQGKYKDKAEEVKTVGEQVRALAKQARDLHKQLISLKAKGKGKGKGNKKNSVVITSTAADITTQIKDIRAQIIALNNGHKKDKEALKALKEIVQGSFDQEKAIKEQIETLKKEKETYEISFKTDLESLNYAKAGDDYKNIVETKASIVDLLKQRQTILNEILVKLNSK